MTDYSPPANNQETSPPEAPPAPKRRNIQRTALVVRAEIVSQHTAPIVLGFRTPRAYLEWVIESGIPHRKRGKDVLVLVSDALAALSADDVSGSAVTSEPPRTVEQECDRVLAALGRRAR